jgi:hypothetical protein
MTDDLMVFVDGKDVATTRPGRFSSLMRVANVLILSSSGRERSKLRVCAVSISAAASVGASSTVAMTVAVRMRIIMFAIVYRQTGINSEVSPRI